MVSMVALASLGHGFSPGYQQYGHAHADARCHPQKLHPFHGGVGGNSARRIAQGEILGEQPWLLAATQSPLWEVASSNTP